MVGGWVVESTCSAGDLGLTPGLGRSPGEGNGNPLQCSCLENSMDRGAWQATVRGVAKSQDMTEQPHMHGCTHTHIYQLNGVWFKLGSICGRHSCEIWKAEKRRAFLLGFFLLLLASETVVLWWQQLSFLYSSSGGPWGRQWVAPLTEHLCNYQRSHSCKPSLKLTPLDFPTI